MRLVPSGDLSALQLAASSDRSVLEQTTAAAAALCGAHSAWLERLTPEAGVVEILASVGPCAPPVGFGPRVANGNMGHRRAFVLPLRFDQQLIGNVVVSDPAPGPVPAASAPGQLELLACVGALALRNVQLARELETASAQADERRFRVTRGIVQHMREVLGAAGAYVQLLDTETELTERQQQYIDGSRRNLETGLRLMAELLELGRVETGRITLSWEPVDVGAVVRGLVRDYELAVGTSGLRLELHVDPGLPRIRTDVDLLRRVLDSLLSNAVRYTPPAGTVVVTAAARPGRRAQDPGNWACISVTDQGPGVREREQVFEEVARAEALGSAPGFRLAISRRLARLLGGDLTLETQEGRGSTFTVWLPQG